jgi:hypothetical protein
MKPEEVKEFGLKKQNDAGGRYGRAYPRYDDV